TMCGAALALASMLLSSPGQYIWLASNVRTFTGIAPDDFYGIRGLLITAGAPWAYPPCAALIAVITVFAIRNLPIPQAFSLTVLATYIATFTVAWYDAAVQTLPLAAATNDDSRVAPVAIFLFIPTVWQISKFASVILLILLWIASVILAF